MVSKGSWVVERKVSKNDLEEGWSLQMQSTRKGQKSSWESNGCAIFCFVMWSFVAARLAVGYSWTGINSVERSGKSNFKIFAIMMMVTKLIPLISVFSNCFGVKICENGLYCVFDGDCQIGNHCIHLFDEKTKKSTRCVPRDDLDESYYCSLSQRSCECE